jgi:transcriptional regulator with XRE-family HTH domain
LWRIPVKDKEGGRMSVMVYSRLGDVLRTRNLTVGDLQRQIAARFDFTVDARTLDRLARDERVRRPDMEIAAAAAAALDARLDDIFAIDALPRGDEDATGADNPREADDVLSPVQSRRLSELFDLQDDGRLTATERIELDALVAAWGQAVNERGIRDLAARRGVPVEEMRAEVLADVDHALVWWRAVQDDPARLETVVNEAREQQQTRIVG